MSTEFSLDLRLARRKAGLTQADVACLLDVQQGIVSRLERGRSLPSLEQIITLSLIYERSFESLFAQIMQSSRQQLRSRITTLPENVRGYVGTFNRQSTLKRLEQRLAEENSAHGEA